MGADPLVDAKTGVAYASEYLLRRLAADAAEEVEVYLGYFDVRGTRPTPDPELGRPLPQRRFPSAVYLKLLAFGLAPPLELLWGRRFDAVFCTNNYLMPSFARRRAVIIHDLGYLVCPEHLRPGRPGLVGRLLPSGPAYLAHVLPRAARRADVIVTWSHTVRDELVAHLGVPREKILVTPFLPDAHHRPDPSARPPERLDLDRPFVLCQATIEPRKNHRVLVEAFARLAPEVAASTTLVLAGGAGWSSERLLARVEELKGRGLDIRVTGYVSEDERLALYRTCTVAVLPSHYEGFGMPVLEALCCGAPVVCSDIPVLREVGGPVCRYFPLDDPDALARLLTDALAAGRPAGPAAEAHQRAVADHLTDLEARGDSGELARRLGAA